jgi:hypothetical protein
MKEVQMSALPPFTCLILLAVNATSYVITPAPWFVDLELN